MSETEEADEDFEAPPKKAVPRRDFPAVSIDSTEDEEEPVTTAEKPRKSIIVRHSPRRSIMARDNGEGTVLHSM
jgi:hypothetical protein